jgi:hypothetical protein
MHHITKFTNCQKIKSTVPNVIQTQFVIVCWLIWMLFKHEVIARLHRDYFLNKTCGSSHAFL